MKHKKDDEIRFPVFRERFNRLFEGRSNTEFAKYLGISRQTVGFYSSGERIPDALGLLQIAEKCNVSADWLLGRSEENAFDDDAQRVNRLTGLSKKAFRNLSLVKGHHPNIDVVNFLLEDKELLRYIVKYISCFIIAERYKMPERYVPIKPGHQFPFMPDIYFSAIARKLPECKAKFENHYKDDREFIEKAVFDFLLQNADRDKCRKFLAECEYEPIIDEEHDCNTLGEDMQDHDGGYTPEPEEEREAAFNKQLQKEREEKAEKEKAIRDFLARAGQ